MSRNCIRDRESPRGRMGYGCVPGNTKINNGQARASRNVLSHGRCGRRCISQISENPFGESLNSSVTVFGNRALKEVKLKEVLRVEPPLTALVFLYKNWKRGPGM